MSNSNSSQPDLLPHKNFAVEADAADSEANHQSAANPPAVEDQTSEGETLPPKRRCLLVCQHTSCTKNGSAAVLEAFEKADVPNVMVSGSDCMGQCSSGPTVQVNPDGTWYCHVTPKDVDRIVDEHLKNDLPVEDLLHPRFHPRFDAYSFS